MAVLEGRYEVEIEDLGTFQAEPDTYLCVPKGHARASASKGDEPAVRVSIRQPDSQALPADRRSPAERRSAHSVIPTVLARGGSRGGPR